MFCIVGTRDAIMISSVVLVLVLCRHAIRQRLRSRMLVVGAVRLSSSWFCLLGRSVYMGRMFALIRSVTGAVRLLWLRKGTKQSYRNLSLRSQRTTILMILHDCWPFVLDERIREAGPESTAARGRRRLVDQQAAVRHRDRTADTCTDVAMWVLLCDVTWPMSIV